MFGRVPNIFTRVVFYRIVDRISGRTSNENSGKLFNKKNVTEKYSGHCIVIIEVVQQHCSTAIFIGFIAIVMIFFPDHENISIFSIVPTLMDAFDCDC